MSNYGILRKFIDYTFKKNKFNSIRSYYYLAKKKIDRQRRDSGKKVYTIYKESGKVSNPDLKQWEYEFNEKILGITFLKIYQGVKNRTKNFPLPSNVNFFSCDA